MNDLSTAPEIPDLSHGYAQLDGVRLHYVEAGEGPLVILLHGFPEFWFGWHRQIPMLAAAGFRVVAPDMRGYNLSDKPQGWRQYDREQLAGDVAGLIRHLGAERAHVVGHDWGAIVAWYAAMDHPEVVERLVILDGPHPRKFTQGLRSPRQIAKSWYVFSFLLPWLPERLARAGGWWAFRRAFEHDARPGAFTPGEIDRYVEAWSQPGAATATVNYYRALVRRYPRHLRARHAPVLARTLIVWAERDRYLAAAMATPEPGDVPNLERVVFLPTSHWVQHDEPDRVGRILAEFLGGDQTAAG